MEFSSDLCNEKHTTLDKRVSHLEDSLDKNLIRIYDEFKLVSGQMMKRVPVWVMILISVLSSICAGMAVAIVK